VRTIFRWPLFLLACATLVSAAACTSSDNLAPPSGGSGTLPSSEPTLPAGHPTVDPGVAALPVEALLAEVDFDANWVQGSHADDPMAPIDSDYCGKKLAPLPWTHVAQFANDKTGDLLIEIMSKFPDEAAAQAAVKEQRDATASCDTWSSGSGADKIDWHIESTEVVDFGDEGFAQKSTTQAGDPPQTSTDFAVLVRRGDVVILIDEGGAGDMDGADAMAAARKAVDKLDETLKAQ
jgi:hypothetical protein